MTLEEKVQHLLYNQAYRPRPKSFRNFYILSSFVLIFAGLFATYTLVGIPQPLRSLAGASTTPTEIKVTSINSHGFTIIWKTEAVTSGYVVYGTSNTKKDKIGFDIKATSGDRKNYTTSLHEISVDTLDANQLYFYSIISQGREYAASEGSIFTPIKTLPENTTPLESNTGNTPTSGFGDLLK